MPAGVSWPRYLRMMGASVLAMFAGAQVVHQYYLPDLVSSSVSLTVRCPPPAQELTQVCCCLLCQSIPEVPPRPGELRTELRGYRIREEAVAAAAQQLEAEKNGD